MYFCCDSLLANSSLFTQFINKLKVKELKFPLKLCIILPVKVFQFKNHYLELSLSMVPLSKEINRDGY